MLVVLEIVLYTLVVAYALYHSSRMAYMAGWTKGDLYRRVEALEKDVKTS